MKIKNTFSKVKVQSLLVACFLSVSAQAQVRPQIIYQTPTEDLNAKYSIPSPALDITQRFTPRPSSNTKLDFGHWDSFLKQIVIYGGPAVRKRAPKISQTGSRIILRDDSPYRYEGNKVLYTLFYPAQKKWLKKYTKDLEELSNETDITTLSKDDQLAYWYNLHNVALISLIAEKYPVKYPERIKPLKKNPETLHDAKILTISGVPLSLRDIREKIVYPNWKNPLVIYGFHLGNLGSPSVSTQAYDRDTLHYNLRERADIFTNSFRGFRLGKISRLYESVSRFYFPNGESDIRAHFKKYMRPSVYESLESYETLRWHKPLPQIADVAGGVGFGTSAQSIARVGQGGTAALPVAFNAFVRARSERFRAAKRRGWLKGDVIIEDINTEDIDLSKP